MRPSTLLCISTLLLWFGSVQPVFAGFQAGAARADITPNKWPVQLIGNFNERLAEKAWDPLHARAVFLSDDTTSIAIVVIDSCYVPRTLLDDAKQRIFAVTGIPTDHLLMSATHTHSAPPSRNRRTVTADPDYLEQLTQGIVDAVVQAHENREAAEIGWGVAQVPDEVFNRRWFMKPGGIVPDPWGMTNDTVRMNPPRGSDLLDRPSGPTDPDVSVVSIRSATGRPIALLANYSLHYVGGIEPGGASADYFGEFARIMEERLTRNPAPDTPPVVGIMSNGTSGNINNIDFQNAGKRMQPFEKMRQVAKKVADAASMTYETIVYRNDVTLAMAQELLTLNKRRPTARQLELAEQFLAADDESKLPRLAKSYARWTQQLNEPPFEEEIILQALHIGDLAITAIPCETFVETGLELKRKNPFGTSFTIELANGHYGYLPTPEHHRLGGYETWLGTCILEETASEQITAVLLKLLNQLHRSGS